MKDPNRSLLVGWGLLGRLVLEKSIRFIISFTGEISSKGRRKDSEKDANNVNFVCGFTGYDSGRRADWN
ncbi:MAG: hypothetical protein JRJ03_17275 [Deltaproteobacteria bacterium]|nr:hypothetical protein [Deltaproteobacteria bacterium]